MSQPSKFRAQLVVAAVVAIAGGFVAGRSSLFIGAIMFVGGLCWVVHVDQKLR